MKYIFSILTFSIFFNISCHSQTGPTDLMPDIYRIGSKVVDFEMRNVDGKLYSLSSIENATGYIVIFTSNVCPFAVAYEDRIIELHNLMAPKGYPVVAINSNDGSIESLDSFEEMVTRHKEKSFPFLYLKDEKGEYAKFGANKTPHVFLLDNEMIVRYIGAIDDSAREPSEVEEKYLENAIYSIEDGKTPNPETTKAVGCPIKAKGSRARNGGHDRGRKGPPPPERIMEHMDDNDDKKITKEEARGPLARDFDKIDENGDGVLTMEELSNMKKR